MNQPFFTKTNKTFILLFLLTFAFSGHLDGQNSVAVSAGQHFQGAGAYWVEFSS